MEKSKPNSNRIDQLYDELCKSLRKAGKASSFCQLINNAGSDLSRVNILNKECNIVPSLLKVVKKCRQITNKYPERARNILSIYRARKSGKCSESKGESEDSIRLLNSALVHLPVDRKFDVAQFEGFESPNGILALQSFLVEDVIEESDENSILLRELYQERADCFHDLGDHKMVIIESLRAINYAKFNENLLFSSLSRITTSLKLLSRWKEAKNVLQFAIKFLRSSQLDNAAKSVETVKLVKLLKDIQIGANGSGQTNSHLRLDLNSCLESKEENLPKISGSISDTLTNTSSSLQLRWHDDRGRHLVATDSIAPGATLIVEEPFAWIIHSNQSQSFCLNCCLEVRNLIPCSRCSNVVFCSERCRKASEPYHRYECELMEMLTTSQILGDMVLLCYRTISKTDVQFLVSHVREYFQIEKDNEENEKSFRDKFLFGFNGESKLDSSDYCAVFAQTPNTDARLGGDLLKRTFSAILLTICLRLTGYFGSGDEMASDCSLSETEELIACLLLRHSQSTSCNAYGIQKVKTDDPRRLEEMEIGGATYPIVSTTNHSCNSNVYRYSVGRVCVVRALREIQCGEEIFDSYGPNFASSSIDDRVGVLSGQYLFTCCCAACTGNWLPYSQLPRENPCVKCTKCRKGLMAEKKDRLVCTSKCCGHAIDAKKFMKWITDSAKDYQSAKDILLRRNRDVVIDFDQIEGWIVAQTKILGVTQKWPCQALVECQETLKLCWNLRNLN